MIKGMSILICFFSIQKCFNSVPEIKIRANSPKNMHYMAIPVHMCMHVCL